MFWDVIERLSRTEPAARIPFPIHNGNRNRGPAGASCMQASAWRRGVTVKHYTDRVGRTDIDKIVADVAHRLVAAARPDKIILFGSYARGDFDGRSDLDLLVILPTLANRVEEMVRLRRVLKGIPVPIDILVYSTNEVEQRRDLRGTMLYHALKEGRILHDAA
jgi:uncharacterized protein